MAREDHIRLREYLKYVLTDLDSRAPNISYEQKDALAGYFSEELDDILHRCPDIEGVVFADFRRAHSLGDDEISSKQEAKDALAIKYAGIPAKEFSDTIYSRYVNEADREIEHARAGRPSDILKKRYPHICQGFFDYAEIEESLPEQLSVFGEDGEDG